jgi:heme-degrading monooxygenase HmoA
MHSSGTGEYLILWEFRPKKGAEARFEEMYGPGGDWAKFFEQGEGFLSTELVRDSKDPTRYITLDRWISRQAYEGFRAVYRQEYESIDEQCESLTESERELGAFESV